jgi:recombination protein RecT
MTTALAAPAAQPLARPPRTVVDVIQSPHVRAQIALALPKFLTPERMMRIAVTTVNRNPDLQKCTPESVLSSLMTASQMGIEPDGRHGHLIARFNSRLGKHECTFQADYKGLVALVRKSGDVSDIYADVVCEADVFSVAKGLHRDLVHEIDIRRPRGEFLGAYAVILYKEGAPGFDFMGKEEIDAIRDRSDGWKAFAAGRIASTPWGTDYAEMAKKTVLKRLLKLADLSGDTSERVALDVDATVQPLTRMPEPQIPHARVPQPRMLPDAPTTEEPLTPPLPPAETPAAPPRRVHRATRHAKAQEVQRPTPAEAQADAQSEAGERMAAAQAPATPATPPEDIALPGAEPEREPARETAPPVRKLTPPTSTAAPASADAEHEGVLAFLRGQHPDASDAQLLTILIRYQLAKEGTEKLSQLSTQALRMATGDPETIAQEVAALITAEG